MKYLVLLFISLLQGCSTFFNMHSTIEYEQNQYYIEVVDPTNLGTDIVEINNKINEFIKPYCTNPQIIKTKSIGTRLTATTPVLRCNIRACGNTEVFGAYVKCDKKIPFDYIKLEGLKKYDISNQEEKAVFIDYVKGNYFSKDHTVIQTFNDFGYPDIAYIKGFEKSAWFYNRPSGELIIEFTGGRGIDGYYFTKQHMHLTKGNSIYAIELHR